MIDREGAYFLLKRYDHMLQDALHLPLPVIEYRNVQRVVFCGIAAEGILASLTASLIGRVVVHVEQGFTLPSWVGHDDLVVCFSLSGNDDAVLSCFAQARRRNALCFAVSSGGSLLSLARDGGIAFSRVPTGIPAVFATPFLLVPVLGILKSLGVSEAFEHIPGNVLVDERFAEFIARCLVGKTPLVYASSRNMALGQRLVFCLSHIAKTPAFGVCLSAVDVSSDYHRHLTSGYCALLLHDDADDDFSSEKLRSLGRYLRSHSVAVCDIPIVQKEPVYRALHTDLLCSFIAYYLAVLYGVSPKK